MTPAIPAAPSPLRTVVVGFAGKQGSELLPAMKELSNVVGAVDPNPDAAELAKQHGLLLVPDVETALRDIDFDLALVTVPHGQHLQITSLLLDSGKHVIKEKPFANDSSEADQLLKSARENRVGIYTLVQRNYHPAFVFARARLQEVGDPYWFSYDYHATIKGPTSGWRADPAQARGGVLLDMGYHALDVLSRLLPRDPAAVTSALLHRHEATRRNGLEDAATIMLQYPNRSLSGVVNVSRHHHEKREKMTILGPRGSLEIAPERAVLFDADGVEAESLNVSLTRSALNTRMLRSYLSSVAQPDRTTAHMAAHVELVGLLDRLYAADQNKTESA